MGFIAMKGMAGGLIADGRAAAAFMATCPTVVPIWGVQHGWELEQFLDAIQSPIALTEELMAVIVQDKEMLGGDFCRACGYCMPCPVGIEINTCARMSLLLRRSVVADQLTELAQAKMEKINDCTACGLCKTRCPYGLDIPNLLKANYENYRKVVSEHI